jgi:stage V sporulation protein D (sporulation-specific penicillin-binding protein)
VYYGGQVAAPIFRTIMAQALAHLRVPPACPPGARPQQTAPAPAETVAMPDVQGLAPADAERVAAEAGLFLRVEGAGARVLRQVPPAGVQVQRWSTVLAYTTPALALPEHTVTVPDLRGMTLIQAASALAGQGLQLDGEGSGVAIAQTPRPGVALHPGDVVQVTFGSGKPAA